jgi:hypothetical protein
VAVEAALDAVHVDPALALPLAQQWLLGHGDREGRRIEI